jgi:hypothetical protein
MLGRPFGRAGWPATIANDDLKIISFLHILARSVNRPVFQLCFNE